MLHLSWILVATVATLRIPLSSETFDDVVSNPVLFAEAVLLKAGDQAIRTEMPGYAAPSWFDLDEDGRKDLIVGQFRDGKMKVYRNLGDGKLAAGKWLEADDEAASVPGVW
jgi:hypothetical protein